MSGETARWNKADATTPAYGHPELRSADRAFFGPEEGSYKYSAGRAADDSG